MERTNLTASGNQRAEERNARNVSGSTGLEQGASDAQAASRRISRAACPGSFSELVVSLQGSRGAAILLSFAGTSLRCKGKGGSQGSPHAAFCRQNTQMGFWKRQGDRDRHLLGAAAKPYFCTGGTLLRTRWVSFPGSWQLPGTWLCWEQLVAMTNSLWAPNKTSHLLCQHYRGIYSERTFPVHHSCPPF